MENPQAFPRVGIPDQFGRWAVKPQEGMTLLDYFAGQALVGYLFSHVQCASNPDMTAEWSYQQAQAMLKQRELTMKGN